jgi:hypothetical protein
MAAVMAALRLPSPSGVCALQDRYPWVDKGRFTFVPLAQHYMASGRTAEAERLAYNFIGEALAAKPELPTERRLRWWRRLWWWATP